VIPLVSHKPLQVIARMNTNPIEIVEMLAVRVRRGSNTREVM
jgi:hypothetical protein